MHTPFPAGIETYLREAGFSATEILIAQKLLSDDALTLRELAMKTGKSTGVLDQAMRRLIGRGIVQRVMHNNHPKYALQSLDAMVSWAKRDVDEQRAILERKHQNFAQFIGSIKRQNGTPELYFFHGIAGVEKAYEKILETGKEFLTTTPILTTAEEDPLRACRVSIFRTRQVRKIFQRVIATDSPLARRYHSRDPFEYRQTILASDRAEVPMEITIADPLVCCIDLRSHDACVLRFPLYAAAEREKFEREWELVTCYQKTQPQKLHTAPAAIPFSTKMGSFFREHLLRKSSVGIAIAVAIFWSGIVLAGYRYTYAINAQQMSRHLEIVASLSAQMLNPSDIESVKKIDDIRTDAYKRLVTSLQEIRNEDPNIQYAYIMRKGSHDNELTFVADADSLNPDLKRDFNLDGTIDEKDAPNYPGEIYDANGFYGIQKAFLGTISMQGQDQWGRLLSAYSPIYDAEMNPIAIIGLDIFSQRLSDITLSIFPPIATFVFCMTMFFILRFIATNRSLIVEISRISHAKSRTIILLVTVSALSICLFAYQAYQDTGTKISGDIGFSLQSLATNYSLAIQPEWLKNINKAQDMKNKEYAALKKFLRNIVLRHPVIDKASILKITNDANVFAIVGSATSIESISRTAPSFPGDFYSTKNAEILHALKRATYTYQRSASNENIISGLAPIYSGATVIGLFRVDHVCSPAVPC